MRHRSDELYECVGKRERSSNFSWKKREKGQYMFINTTTTVADMEDCFEVNLTI